MTQEDFPMYEQAHMLDVPEERDDSLNGTEAILLVDDDAMVRDIVGRMLRRHGYTVIEACDGMDAINAAGKHDAPIHLVVTDVVMPELTGRQLFYYLRGWYPPLRILFMSGYTRGAIAVRELEDAATAFIAKPFTMDELAVKIRELLDNPSEPKSLTA